MLNKLKTLDWNKIFMVSIFVVAILGGTLAFIGTIATKMTGHSVSVEAEAQEFATNIPDATKVECNDIDADGTGYVSCTVFRTKSEPLAIECASNFSLNHGCRLQKNIGRNYYDR